MFPDILSRAVATAEPIANLLQIPIVKRSQLREMYCGDAEGCSREEREYWLSYWKRWDCPIYPNGETYNDLMDRMTHELSAIARRHPGQKVAIFSHGHSIHAMTAAALGGTNFSIPENCQIYVFTKDSDAENVFRLEGIDSDSILDLFP